MKTLFILLGIFIWVGCKSQSCISVDCKDSVTLPFSSITLTASSSGPTVKTPIWNVYSIPAGALKPVIANPSSFVTSVSGFTNPGIYVFTFSTGNIVLYDTVVTKIPVPIPVPVPCPKVDTSAIQALKICPVVPPPIICPTTDTAGIIKWYLTLHPCPIPPIPPIPPIQILRKVVNFVYNGTSKGYTIYFDDGSSQTNF